MTREDPDALDEVRFVTLGLSNLANLLVVVYAYREPDVIRVISAWKANKRQRELYEEGHS
ncbi:MAG: BrnT family toxin [Candidatus Rokuibacteriota bacterium]